jgi:Polyketide cyclase / dehydrase and lipid transport
VVATSNQGRHDVATIIKEVEVERSADEAWDALQDFLAVHERLVPGFVTAAVPDGDDTRVVTFFNGAVARERLVGVDKDAKRLCYTVVESPLGFSAHSASAQVFEVDDQRCQFVWIADFLPHDVAGRVDELMTQGIAVIQRTLSAG